MLQVTPTAVIQGSAVITVRVTDGAGLNATDTFTVTVTAPNTAPTISNITNLTVTTDDVVPIRSFTVGDSQTADARAWLAAARNAQVLTVAEGALTNDTVIAFVRDNNRIRFDINRAAAARRGLNVSSKLLRLARQVRD